MTDPQNHLKSVQDYALDLAVGVATGPILLGLMAIQAGEKWLRNLEIDEQSWWFNQQLPPLDRKALDAREQVLASMPEQQQQGD